MKTINVTNVETITVMEKVYKDNQFILYINGLRGVIAQESIIDSVVDVLKALSYNIKEINYVMALTDDVPNNEANYRPSAFYGKQAVKLNSIKHYNGYLNTERNVYINNVLVSRDGNIDIIAELLANMGHFVVIDKKKESVEAEGRMLSKLHV